MPYKENRAGEQQPYVPAGNGERSGEYTFKDDTEDFCKRNECTKTKLRQKLSKDEYDYVVDYSAYENGTMLNKAIRLNCLSPYGIRMRDGIISAINKSHLNEDTVVYRGISVSEAVYFNNFYYPFKYGVTCKGSTICSTSRSFDTAIMASKSTENYKNLSLVFETVIPKRHHALSIEAIAFNRSEKEILLNAPRYRIEKIENWHCGDFKFKKIYIKIEENYYANRY